MQEREERKKDVAEKERHFLVRRRGLAEGSGVGGPAWGGPGEGGLGERPTLANPVLTILIWPIWANPILADPSWFWPKPMLAKIGFGQFIFGSGVCHGGALGVGPRKERSESGTLKGGGPKISAFFPLPPPFRSFCVFGCLLVEFWWCLKRRGLKCARLDEAAGVSHDSPRGSRPSKTPPKFNERSPKRGRKKENCGERGKKESKILGGPAASSDSSVLEHWV